MIDLDAIAAEERRKSGPPCWLCGIPERAWAEKARREGTPLSVIQRTLVRAGYPPDVATRSRVESHFERHVR